MQVAQIAPNWKRLINVLVDSAIALILQAFLLIFIRTFDQHLAGLITGSLFVQYIYGYLTGIGILAVFEWLFQRTPGKLLTKTKVISLNGEQLSFGQALKRNSIRVIPFEWLPMIYDIEDKEARIPLHDKWSNTRVIAIG